MQNQTVGHGQGHGPRDTFRRHIRHIESLPCGIESYGIKSLTRDDVKHKTEIDRATGEVQCSCEWFRFRLAKSHPTLATPDLWCKHIERAVASLSRQARKTGVFSCCHTCGEAVQGSGNDFYPLCDDRGEPVPGLICARCAPPQERDPDELFADETLVAALAQGNPATLEQVESAPFLAPVGILGGGGGATDFDTALEWEEDWDWADEIEDEWNAEFDPDLDAEPAFYRMAPAPLSMRASTFPEDDSDLPQC